MILWLWFLPQIAYLALVAFFLIKRTRAQISKALLASLLFYLIALVLGYAAVRVSRSSTAGIGLLFIPYYSFLPALMGFGLAYANKKWQKACLIVLAIGCYSFQASDIFRTQEKNQQNDELNRAQEAQIRENQKWVREIEKNNPEQAAQILSQKAAENPDRTMLIPIAESSFISAELLNELSQSKDFGVTLTALRNSKITAESIEKIYRTHSYPDYFLSDMAALAQTPRAILLELYDKRATNTGIEHNLARNPGLPDELMIKLQDSQNALVLGELARNPKSDCPTVLSIRKKIESLPADSEFRSTGIGWSQDAFEKCRALAQ